MGFENILSADTPGFMRAQSGPDIAAGYAWRPNGVILGAGPYRGRVRGTAFKGETRSCVLETALGTITAETGAADQTYAMGQEVRFDLPLHTAAPLERVA